jgi:hypothetical protein
MGNGVNALSRLGLSIAVIPAKIETHGRPDPTQPTLSGEPQHSCPACMDAGPRPG